MADLLPIMDVAHNMILSKRGDISIVFKVALPEIFTLSDANYETMHQSFIKAIKILPKGTIFHKQDFLSALPINRVFPKGIKIFFPEAVIYILMSGLI
ncbi:DUF3875 domain-containing protein [Niabella ginsengisoli]|uniref:DUF3875 domain-containing protein n=1 Tax=Niabella ginsengisoli TaxID=522298 RepID=A0ABS9SHY8_9BACT|nr:DUF3875 domain-containing protein [Niabella ginsengisoli]MCH5597940.1 DUF3875 domain-containing protein [Niabella ginsengisoli]